jgi:hypothetical protein
MSTEKCSKKFLTRFTDAYVQHPNLRSLLSSLGSDSCLERIISVVNTKWKKMQWVWVRFPASPKPHKINQYIILRLLLFHY